MASLTRHETIMKESDVAQPLINHVNQPSLRQPKPTPSKAPHTAQAHGTRRISRDMRAAGTHYSAT